MSVRTREAFEKLLRLDGTLGLTDQQVRGVALMLTVAGATPPLPVWDEPTLRGARREGTIVEDAEGTVFRFEFGGWRMIGADMFYVPEAFAFPVKVRHLP